MENVAIEYGTEQPAVAVLGLGNLALVVGNLSASAENKQPRPGFVPQGIQSLPPASPQDSFSAAASKPGSLPNKDASAGFSESGRLSRLASDGAGRRSFPQGQRSAQDIGSAHK